MSKRAFRIGLLYVLVLLPLTQLDGAPISFRFEGSSFLNVALEALGFASPPSAEAPATLKGFRIAPIISPDEKRDGRTRTLRNDKGERVIVAIDEGIQPNQVVHAQMFKEEQQGEEEMDVKLSLHLNGQGAERLSVISVPGSAVAIMVGERLFMELQCREALKQAHLMVTGKVNMQTLLALERALGVKAQAKPTKDFEKIVQLARKARRQERLNEKEHLACTYLQLAWKSVQRARKLCEDETIKNILPSRLAFEKGMAHAMCLDVGKAEEQFEIAAKDPSYRPMALSYLGDIYRLQGNVAKARKAYLEAQNSVPKEKKKFFACLFEHIGKRLSQLPQ